MNTLNTSRLRATIGWLALALPWLVCLIVGEIPNSISATYYTNAGPVFMIVLGSASLLLFSYKGYDKVDDYINTGAAVAGLCICLFPCYHTPFGEYPYVGTLSVVSVDVSSFIHNASAAVFFALLALNSLFRFTKSGAEYITPNKKKRNVIYRICGIGMIASFPALLLDAVVPWSKITWLVEAVALFFFAISWLTKADRYAWLFADEADSLISKAVVAKIRRKKDE